MLGHFPTPYPDELVYSLCARFSERVSYSSAKSILKELFGAPTASAVIDLPNRLGHLAAALPTGTSLTLDNLILRHTLFPFFSAFFHPLRVMRLRKSMASNCGPAIHMRSGIMASRIPLPTHLRFCSTCKKENKECSGEAYWHRLHQLPGVEVCPSHQTFLENSRISLRAGRKHFQFISAEQATPAMPVRPVNIENRDHLALLQLARDAKWLLEHPSAGTILETMHSRYLRLLIERGLATYTGSIHVKKILHEFGSYYSPALLKQLNCELRGSNMKKSNWLLWLVRPPKHTQHPLHHLLLIQFLGCTVEEFCQLPEKLTVFGEGPWPCLNPAAAHYKRPLIRQCQPSKRLRHGKLTVKFSCECGFAYVRTGPDLSPDDRFRIGRIISFGQAWEAKLKHLWSGQALSISEIGRRLGVDPLTVRRHAARLDLPLSRSDKKLKPLTHATQLKGKAVSAAWGKKRCRCRSKWLSVLKQRQEITMKALRGKLPREYAWLLEHDYDWLKGHKPSPHRRSLSTTSVDWKKRDTEYAVAVKAAASRLKNISGRPVQVTRTAIGRDVGAITLLRQKLHKMPLTAAMLDSVVETREQYALRRIWWAANKFYQENLLPSKWKLISKANVYRLLAAPDIMRAIKDALDMLASVALEPQVQII